MKIPVNKICEDDAQRLRHLESELHRRVVERGYGGCIPSEAGSEKRAGQGAEHKRQAIPEAGAGYEPAVGGEILTGDDKGHDALSAMAGVIVFNPARGFVSSHP